MSKYKISVVTPFHNVEKSYFSKTWESMLAQTIGFKNIEWIIILHNCEAKYAKFVKEYAKGHSNVKIHELNDNSISISSPRNYSLQFVTCNYVGFLDGDDWYTPNVLEEALKAAEADQPDVLAFRMEYGLEDSSCTPIDERNLWNQTEEKIVITRKNFDNKKVFADNFHFVTSKLFRMKFLKDKKLNWDNRFPVVEDYIFTLKCLCVAKKIVYLPRLIGYHYCIHRSSMAQGGHISEDVFMKYVAGVEEAIRIHDKYKVQSDSTMGYCCWLAGQILSHPDLSFETREKVKQKFEKFLKSAKIKEPDKLYPIDRLAPRYWMAKSVLLNPKEPAKAYFRDIVCDSLPNFTSIIKQNCNTDFGLKYNFKTIKDIRTYQSRVPIMHEKNYDEIIRLQTNIGESNILVNGYPANYFLNSNGKRRMNTMKHYRDYDKTFIEIFEHNTTFLVAHYSTKHFDRTNDGCRTFSLQDFMLKNYFWNFRDINKSTAKFTSEDTDYFKRISKEEHYKLLLKDALKNKNITQIYAFDIKELLYMFSLLPANKQDIQKIWPKLKLVVATNYNNNRTLYKKLKNYIGNIDYSNGLYFTEEGILGRSINDDGLYVNFSDSNFYELYDINSEKAIKFSDAKKDHTYRLVITNHAGMYRFLSNYKIKIEQTYPQLTFRLSN